MKSKKVVPKWETDYIHECRHNLTLRDLYTRVLEDVANEASDDFSNTAEEKKIARRAEIAKTVFDERMSGTNLAGWKIPVKASKTAMEYANGYNEHEDENCVCALCKNLGLYFDLAMKKARIDEVQGIEPDEFSGEDCEERIGELENEAASIALAIKISKS